MSEVEETTRARFFEVLCAVAREVRFPKPDDVKVLGPLVAALSASYNKEAPQAPGADRALLPARLAFSLPRDIPKVREAVRELVAMGLLDKPKLRVLDLGAGLGASTFGLWDALVQARPAGAPLAMDAVLCDSDADALALAARVAKQMANDGPAPNVTTRSHSLGQVIPRGPFDVILLGQVLSEDLRDLPDEERVVRHGVLVRGCMKELAADGSLVIVEPALRTRSRHLHHLRDHLAPEMNIFAPCTHREGCGALIRETDWCHEDRPVDLPDWLIPIARAAGLRFEGLTFSYLVLRKDTRSVAEGVAPGSLRYRLVSNIRRSKGKSEAFFCGGENGEFGVWMRTGRDGSESNSAFDSAVRGDLLDVHGPLLKPRRIGPATCVDVAELGASGLVAAAAT